MGSCNSRDSIAVTTRITKSCSLPATQIKSNNNLSNKEYYQILIESYDPKFRNMPEWEGERFRGEGVKRMKGYKCDLNIDVLNRLREDFWGERMREKAIWRNIRQACLMDDGILL